MANVTATTGWVFTADDDPGGNLTIDSGSNRKLVVGWLRENNTDPNPTSITVGGQAPDESFSYSSAPPGSSLEWHYWWIWNESTIASMTSAPTPTLSLTATTASFGRGWFYGVVEDTDQSALSSLTGTVTGNGVTSANVTTTSNSGDLAVVAAIIQLQTRTIDSWDTLTEIADLNCDGMKGGLGAGNGGDATTTVTIDSAEDLTLSSLVFPNAAAASSIAPQAMYHLRYH